jgi:UDP-N-acetylglucosamine--N-acetylmuramyl-(pentapeptide) pyrophosphoryl-undecaprenol N-acetylglucosamine transferase
LSPPERVHFGVYGSGLGHVARSSLVAEALVPYAESYFTCWGEGMEYLANAGLPCAEVPPVDVEWGEAGRMAFRKTLRRFPYAYVNFARQTVLERDIMLRMKPGLVVSDSRLSSVMAAWLCGVPRVLIINQLRISLPPVAGGLRSPIERISAELLALAWDRSQVILAPDLPPPYTLSEQQLWNVKVAEGKLKYVGFLMKAKEVSDEERSSIRARFAAGRKLVFAQISGPSNSRSGLLLLIRKIAPLLPGEVSLVVSFGDPGGDPRPQFLDGLTLFEWCPIKEELMASSDLVIARGGHTTIAEAMTRGKPGLFIPIPYHGEQWGNAMKAQKLGFARALNPLTVTPRQAASAVQEVLSDGSYQSRALEVQRAALVADGIANTVAVIRDFL